MARNDFSNGLPGRPVHRFGRISSRGVPSQNVSPRSTSPLQEESKSEVLAGVIAVIGCDGSGKSRLTGDLLERLGDSGPVELVYLGQSSGSIGRWIKGLPLVGSSIGRSLERKAERSHEQKEISMGAATAVVIYLFSRWRAHKFKRMLALSRRGICVITDRYPQSEVLGFHFDGPGLDGAQVQGGVARKLAARELRLYRWMARHVPALVIRLNIDAETAHERKPDHKLERLRKKTAVIPKLRFHGAKILELDSREPYAKMLNAALLGARSALGRESR